MKKIVALALAAVMALALVGASFADVPTGKVTITGLESGDSVKLYKVIEWGNGNWVAVNGYSDVIGTDNFDKMDATKAQAIAAAAKNASTSLVDTNTADSTGTYEKTGLPVGMYVAIVTSATGTNIYNPMIVSVNFLNANTASDGELNITSDVTTIGTSAVVKKQGINFDKEVNDTTNADPDHYETVEPGDVIPFKITTTLPSYDAPYTAPVFKVSDTLTGGITLNQDSIVVKVAGADKTTNTAVVKSIDKTDKSFVVTFNPDYMMRDGAPEAVEITYTGTVSALGTNPANVTVYNNSAKVEYSHNPDDEQDVHKEFADTNHYTFSIDAGANGLDGGRSITSELVKIGVDDNGDTITSWKVTSDSWEEETELAGATFRLTRHDGAAFADGSQYKEMTTTSTGHISFSGLEEGVYDLEEVSAPAGYIKSDVTATITITAEMKPEKRTVVEDGVSYTYDVEVLDSYSIAITDGSGTAMTEYTVTNIADDFGSVTVDEDSNNETFPFVNTKGLELPSTGGIGTTIFYVSGLVLVLGAAAILVARRKAEAE